MVDNDLNQKTLVDFVEQVGATQRRVEQSGITSDLKVTLLARCYNYEQI
jgi:hypothetical protein